jgi:two-component sensor histidine kinase
MIHKLLRRLGPVGLAILSSAVLVLFSVLLYWLIGFFLGGVAFVGFVMSVTVPSILAPFSFYVLFRLLFRLDLAQEELLAMARVLESRVEERTAELVKANQELQAEIAVRKRVEKQLVVSIEEKEVLLREIHHRVKNNLQIISSLLSLQADYVSEPRVVGMFRDSQRRVRSMALIHERLYQSQGLARVDFGEYVRSLIDRLFDVMYGPDESTVNLEVDTNDISLAIDTIVPCGLIVSELVSNSLKHAFPDGRGGKIRISLHSDGPGRFELIVADDGIGFPQDLDFQGASTLGLQLVSTLARQLGGSIAIDRDRRGVTVRVGFRDRG